MIELLLAVLRYAHSSLEVALASNAQVTVLLLGVVGVAGPRRGRPHRCLDTVPADRRPMAAPRAERPRRARAGSSEGTRTRGRGRVAISDRTAGLVDGEAARRQ